MKETIYLGIENLYSCRKETHKTDLVKNELICQQLVVFLHIIIN